MQNLLVSSDTLPHVLGLVRERTGVDFSVYRVATMQRRVLNHMVTTGISSPVEYLEFLERSADATKGLLERLTIKVSSFYRNRDTFDALRERVLPQLAEERGGEPLRIWSAGCAGGEEPYTLAMILEERGIAGDIIATDIDESALTAAAAGCYDGAAAASLPRELAESFLVPHLENGRARVALVDAVRSRVRFARHDITRDSAPGSDTFDLLCCRNVLIYLQRDMQRQVLWRLRRAIAPGGYLSLGESEWPSPELGETIVPLHRKTRLFFCAMPALPPGELS
jgi:chemotaxis methyl-accepting protein methylase